MDSRESGSESIGRSSSDECTIRRNESAHGQSDVSLSILVPFYNQNPAQLLDRLITACAEHPGLVEIVMADDGSDDTGPAHRFWARMRTTDVPCSMLISRNNLGRSRIRNLLGAAARGDYIVFLDGDMKMISREYITDYICVFH